MSNDKTFKGTPGPWEAKPARTLIHIGPVRNGGFVASLSRHAIMPKEVHEANARLIAAAPTGLDANIAALDILERMGPPPISRGGLCEEQDYHATVALLRAAIAKALGE